jgi:hypothetical protein
MVVAVAWCLSFSEFRRIGEGMDGDFLPMRMVMGLALL